MDLDRLVERLDIHSRRSLWTLGPDGQAGQMSFGEIRRRVEDAIRSLRERGVTAGMRIGILAENCPEWIIHDLALITLGCTSVAFPRELAEESWRDLFDRFDLSLMLVSIEEKLPLDVMSGRVHFIDGATPWTEPALPPRKSHAPGGFIPALTFSSGSTGKLKCMITNPAGVEFDIEHFYGLYGISARDRLLIFLPFNHYQQRQCAYAAIWFGVDIALVQPKQLFQGFQRLAPTLCLAPPLLYETIYAQFHNRVDKLPAPVRRAFRALTAAIPRLPTGRIRRLGQRLAYGGVRKALGGSMRAMSTGMAPIKRDVLDFFAHAGIPLYEAYGTGETGLITANAPGVNRPGSVGKPIAEGVATLAEDGEILVRNKHLSARGYLNTDDGVESVTWFDPEQMATGDIGRFDQDGFLYLVGRKKEIIITSNGLKIHPEVVEAKLNHHNLVERSAVFGESLPHLVAVIVPRVALGPAVEGAIRAHVQAVNKTLSTGTQVSRVIFSSESFTFDNGMLTRTLKLDRRAIFGRFEPELHGARAGAAARRSTSAPSLTESERKLMAIWRDVLGREDIGKSEGFLEMGGNSLQAVQIIARVQEMFQVELPLRRLFEAATIEALAREIDQARQARPGGAAPQPHASLIRHEGTTREHPLSYAQQRMWFMQQLAPDSRAYHLSGALTLDGTLDTEVLRRAFLEVVARHDILRTRFPVQEDGVPVAMVHDRVDVAWELIDVSELAKEAQEERVRELARLCADMLFDLERGPLLRVMLVRQQPDRHVFILSMHHIISDGWSMAVFARDMSAAYRARVTGRAAGLPPLPIQCQDFTRYQRAQVESGALDAQRDFWRKTLAGAPEHLELPYDIEPPSSPRFAGDIVRGHLPATLRRRLEALGREHDATLPMALLAVFDVLLHRYSGQDDLVVGVPVANRTIPEIEPLIGCFVNTLAHRADLSGEPRFRDVLGRVRDSALDAFSNQDLPLDLLVDQLRPARAHSQAPFFQTLFVFQNAPATEPMLDGMSISITVIPTGTAKLDLSLEVIEAADGGLDLVFEYCTEFFERDTIADMATSMERLVAACVDAPDRKVSRLPLTDEPMRQRMLHEWNRTEAAYPLHLGIHQVIEQQAAATPDAVALRFEGRSMTYRELDRKANALARMLMDRGVAADQIVGVYLERSMDMVLAILAVLKASAVYLPIDPMNPPGRIAYMLEDTRATLVLTQRRLSGRLPAGITALDLGTIELTEDEDTPPWRGTPDSLLNVLYTSGSTGRPKGVEVHHRGICNYLYWRQSEVPMTSTDRMLQKTSIGFDVSCLELFQPLMNGATLVLCRPGSEMDVDYLVDLITSEGVTFIHFVPSVLHVFLQGSIERCRSLRYVFTSGEALSKQAMLRCLERLPWVHLYNEYGPTECSVNCSFWRCTLPLRGSSPPIGQPVANCQLYVLDDDLQPVPPRMPGELFIGGVGLAHGYLRREDLTRERFVPDPFDAAPERRLYRSGDLVRYRHDGLIEYLGRRDLQVKLRGFRLELGEIEAALASLPGVREAVATIQGEGDDKRLVAFVVTEPGAQPEAQPEAQIDEAELLQGLRDGLPPHMVPSLIRVCDGLPRTSSGKLDRNALPRLDMATRHTRTTYVAPRNRIERQIAEIWRAVLKVEPVGIHDNFFDLGGHSFAATHVVARLRSALGGNIPLSIAFQAPTIAQLADALASRIGADAISTPLTLVDRAGPLPLSFAQERLWWEHKQYASSPIHNLPMTIRFGHGCDIDALEHGLNELFRRHEALRTIFPARHGKPVQVIVPPERLSIPITDLSHISLEQQDRSLQETVLHTARRPFDLEHEWPFRVELFKLSDSDYLLGFVLHHIVTDGWSQELLAHEFSELYQSAIQRRPCNLPAIPYYHADFACQQRKQVELGIFDSQLRYWKDQLRGRTSYIKLQHKNRSQSLAGARCSVRISKDLLDRTRAMSKEAGVTLFVTLLAAFKSLLGYYSGQDDLCIGSPITGRHAIESHGVVGLFLNVLVLRTKLSGDPCFRDIVKGVHESAINAYANQDVPFEKVADELWVEEQGARDPLFNIMFILQNPQDGAHPRLAYTDVKKLYAGIAVYELTLSLTESDEGLSGWVDYRADTFDERFIASMVRDFEHALTVFTRTPDVRLSSLPSQLEALAGVSSARIAGRIQ